MKMWKLKEEVSPIDYIPLNRRIEWIARSVLVEKGGNATTDDVLTAIYTLVQNVPLTPEEKEIIDVLRAIAVPRKTNSTWFWRLKSAARPTTLDEFKEGRVEKEVLREEKDIKLDHVRIVRAIATLGLKFLKYNVWIGRPERRKTSELNKVCNVSEIATPVSQRTIERMQNIDVIWMKNSSVPVSMFEAESGDAHSDILRMSNVLQELPIVKAILVLADDNINQMNRIPKEPAIKELIAGYDFFFTTYTSIASLLDLCERGHTLQFRDLLTRCKKVQVDAFS